MDKLNQLKTPPLLQNIQWIADPVGFMENAAQQHPDIFTAQVAGFGSISQSLTFVYEPSALQQILTNNYDFSAPANRVLSFFLGDNSLTTLEGSRHQRHRKLMAPVFHGGQLQDWGSQIQQIANYLFFALPPGQPFRLMELAKALVLEVMLKAVFGFEGLRYEQLKKLSQDVIGLFDSKVSAAFLLFPWMQRDLGPWSFWGQFLRRKQALDDFIFEEIRERDRHHRNDIFSLLMSAVDEDGRPMSEVELRDELLTLMLGGVETTAIVLTWALYWVHYLPDLGDRLREELISSQDPIKLPYLSAVCNETLRMYPPFPLTLQRRVEKPVELLGHRLEAGTDIVGCIYLLHHRQDLYPHAKEFMPERFLEKQFSPYEFMPFGAGTRRCIGSGIATYIIKLALMVAVSGYEFELVSHRPVKAVRRNLAIAPERKKLKLKRQK